MGSRTILFLALFLLCAGGALFLPLLGLLGYMAHYIIGPEGQWWTAPLRPYEIRYSLMLAVMAAVRNRARIPRNFAMAPRFGPSHEKTLVALWRWRGCCGPSPNRPRSTWCSTTPLSS